MCVFVGLWVYVRVCARECAHTRVCVDLSDRLRCSFAMGNTTRQGAYFSKGHILTISPTVKRICPSTGEYIMHADPKILIWTQ